MSGSGYGRRLLAMAGGFVAMILAPAVAVADTAAQMMSHRGLYSMSLQTSSRTSDVAQLGGHMVLEIADTCDGWTLEQRVALIFTTVVGDEVASYTSFTSWEADDGQRFHFEQQTRQGNVLIDELSGDAKLNGDQGGVAMLDKPYLVEVALPPGTVFPNMHTEMLIKRAAAGDTFFNRIVFDGTSVDNPNHVTAFIGAPIDGPRLAQDEQAPRVWPVRLAFFQIDAQNPEPDVGIGLLLEPNGVTRAIELDYGSFVIDGRLDELEFIPPIDC
ncbi:MAG: DUF1849 family protein [Pseudomonadota bacterium]|nr:DUF1849 family protein [Pseudomonadota bacterium]